MNVIAKLTDDGIVRYRRSCTGEKLGWVIYLSDATFVLAHRILFNPLDGPVIIIDNEILEVDPDLHEVYETEEAAKEAYYAQHRHEQ